MEPTQPKRKDDDASDLLSIFETQGQR
jgi:hypothetical protein